MMAGSTGIYWRPHFGKCHIFMDFDQRGCSEFLLDGWKSFRWFYWINANIPSVYLGMEWNVANWLYSTSMFKWRGDVSNGKQWEGYWRGDSIVGATINFVTFTRSRVCCKFGSSIGPKVILSGWLFSACTLWTGQTHQIGVWVHPLLSSNHHSLRGTVFGVPECANRVQRKTWKRLEPLVYDVHACGTNWFAACTESFLLLVIANGLFLVNLLGPFGLMHSVKISKEASLICDRNALETLKVVLKCRSLVHPPVTSW